MRSDSRTWPSTEKDLGSARQPDRRGPDAAGNGGWDPLDPDLAPDLLAEDAGVENDEAYGPSPTTRVRGRSRLGGPTEELPFTRLSAKATLPTRAHDNDAGLDLYAAEAARIGPGQRVSVGTGLAVAIPEGLAGLVVPRSGLALKHGIALVNSPGLIDPGYRGEIRVLLLNTDGTSDFRVSPGERIAQLLLVPIAHASPIEAASLDASARGPLGFGSSGL
jgi:dUTP diphosphatase